MMIHLEDTSERGRKQHASWRMFCTWYSKYKAHWDALLVAYPAVVCSRRLRCFTCNHHTQHKWPRWDQWLIRLISCYLHLWQTFQPCFRVADDGSKLGIYRCICACVCTCIWYIIWGKGEILIFYTTWIIICIENTSSFTKSNTPLVLLQGLCRHRWSSWSRSWLGGSDHRWRRGWTWPGAELRRGRGQRRYTWCWPPLWCQLAPTRNTAAACVEGGDRGYSWKFSLLGYSR